MKTVHLFHVEGIDGAGKTTFCNQLLELLRRERSLAGETVADKVLKFPTAYPERKFTSSESVHAALFYMKDFSSKILEITDDPNCFEHYVLDRSFVSTAVYQGFNEEGWGGGDNYRVDAIFKFNSLGSMILNFCSNIFHSTNSNINLVHHIIHIDICPNIAFDRLKSRIAINRIVSDPLDELILKCIDNEGEEAERFKSEALNTLSKLDSKYTEVLRLLRNRFVKNGSFSDIDHSLTITKINVNNFTLETNIALLPQLVGLKHFPVTER